MKTAQFIWVNIIIFALAGEIILDFNKLNNKLDRMLLHTEGLFPANLEARESEIKKLQELRASDANKFQQIVSGFIGTLKKSEPNSF